MTTILLGILLAIVFILGWLQQRTFNQTLTELQRRNSEDMKEWGTKALVRAEAASKQALQTVSKTNDSLCLIFQSQMAPQAQQSIATQPELQLAWEGSVPHPQEVREMVEDQLERRRQWSPLAVGVNPQAWSDPTQVAESLKENQNGAERPPDPSLMALDYDPSP